MSTFLPRSGPPLGTLSAWSIPSTQLSEARLWTAPEQLPVKPAAPCLAQGSPAVIWGDVKLPERETQG